MKPLTTIRDLVFGPNLTETQWRHMMWPSPESFLFNTSIPKDQLSSQQKADLIYDHAAKKGRADTVRGIVSAIIGTHTAPHGWLYDSEEISRLTERRIPKDVMNTILDRPPRRRHVPVSDQHLSLLLMLFGIGSSVWRDVDLTPYRDQPDYLDDFRPPFDVEDFSR